MTAAGSYLVGALLVVAGLAVGAFLLNVPLVWIVGGVVAVGLGSAAVAARRLPPPAAGPRPPAGPTSRVP